MRRQTWLSDTSNKRIKQIKQQFQQALNEQAKQSRINYYDFLLVAKKLAYRFEESSHLMALKNFFSKNKNSILTKKLVDCLCINQESINAKDDKIIVKFNVPENDFAPIKEVTNQDEEEYYHGESDEDENDNHFKKVGSLMTVDQNNQEINQKMTIILSIKLEEMEKKLKLLTNQFHYPNIFTVFDNHPEEEISYEKFKEGILTIISDIKDKIRISEDDIKTIFHILTEDEGESSRKPSPSKSVGSPNKEKEQKIERQSTRDKITFQDLQKFKNLDLIEEKMKNFYHSRINRDMVKNTLFKLGRVKNSSIQIYQLKNASVLEFQQLEQQIVNEPLRSNLKKRIPHFGPLKGATKWKKGQRHYTSTDLKYTPHNSSGNNLHAKKGYQIEKQRQKIEKILRNSKQEKKKDKHGETVASKLRSLFIHKVILPREKMLEEEKMKYGRGKQGDYQLSIRPLKDTR